MIPVILETPYAAIPGDPVRTIEYHLRYLRTCMWDAIVNHGEAPLASHGLYTQPGVLRDEDPKERELGIQAGFAWRAVAKKTVIYTDLGISRGMQYGIDHAKKLGHEIEFRTLHEDWGESGRSYGDMGYADTRRWGRTGG